MIDRDWTKADEKCRQEGRCRRCGVNRIERAHLAPRTHDERVKVGSKKRRVAADNCVPLCPSCHRKFDHREIDILEYLTIDEQLHVVRALGGIENARMRLAPLDYKPHMESARLTLRAA
jgi:hypothetical protein